MSQAGIVDLISNNPSIPTQFDADTSFAIPVGNVLEIKGTAAQGISTAGDGLNKITITAADATTASKGVAQFDPANFTVVAGVVSAIGGGGSVTSVSGTANRITSTGGATPVIDIDAAYVGQASITTLGTVATGTWSGTAIGPTFGGTGQTTYATGDLLYASAVNTLSKLAAGTNTHVLTLVGGIPSWEAPSTLVSGIYGDGSDGELTWDGAATILGLVPAANVYTLNRDIFMGTSTINSGISIVTNGFKIFCNGTLTNNGTIRWNGNDGATAGTAGASVSNANSSIWPNVSGSAGGAGTTATGSVGATSPTTPFGGRGGSGGLGSSGAGGASQALATVATTKGSFRSLTPASTLSLFLNNTATYGVCGGTGGGGGGGDGVNPGGGGGSAGGALGVYAYLISGTGTISAIGGAGGSRAVGNTGGGGGGGGGAVVVISRSAVAGAVAGQTISVAGGAGGTKSGTGVNGVAGADGTKVVFSD